MEGEQILAFRLARSGLARRDANGLAQAAACPASDFSREAALLALAARLEGLTRERYDADVDSGALVVAHSLRGAIHALAPHDLALVGPAPRRRPARRRGAFCTSTLRRRPRTSPNGPVSPGRTRSGSGRPSRESSPRSPWEAEDLGAERRRRTLASPPAAAGIRLIPPGDPYLQRPNRPLLAPEPELRKRLFRPVASPGAVLKEGRLTGTWRPRRFWWWSDWS